MKPVFFVGFILAASLSFHLISSHVDNEPTEIDFPADFTPITEVDEVDLSREPASLYSSRNVSSGKGRRRPPVKGASRNHKGTDYAASCGTKVPARSGGIVKIAGRRKGYGNTVAIAVSKRCRAIYAHLSRIKVRVGSKVRAGQIIGNVGSTGISNGCHLHYEGCSNLYALDEDLLEDLPFETENIQSAEIPEEDANPVHPDEDTTVIF